VLRGIVSNHLIPAFGAQELRSITRNHVKTFVTTKHQSLSPGHVRNLMRTLHTICAQAVDDEVMDRNPASKLGKFLPEKRVDPEQGIDPFTSAELERYLTTMQGRYPQYYPYFLTLARTGMREGEALGLRWDDIQFGQSPGDPHRFIHVQRTYDSAHNLMNTPKSGKTRRVDMAKDLRACLPDWREHCFEQAVLAGRRRFFPSSLRLPRGIPGQQVGSMSFTSVVAPWLDSGPRGSMTSDTATPPLCSMSCMRLSSTSVSSSGIRVSRFPSISTAIRARA
jgi:integrase